MANSEQKTRDIAWSAAAEGENNTGEDWVRITSKWSKFNCATVTIILGMSADKRSGLIEKCGQMSSEGADDEDYLQFLINLSSLSDVALNLVAIAILNNESKGIYER